MTEQMKIEELLNSYIDGELSVRQRTEVNRMISNDPKLAGRLRELRQCKTLVNSLPVTQAPSNIMENVKARLEKNKVQEKEPVRISEYREVKTSRRIFAAAAMFSLTALLVVVINMLIPNQIGNHEGHYVSADINLSGRLELQAENLRAMDSVISKAIRNIGLADYANPLVEANQRIYTLNCSKEGLDRILNELEGRWDEISSAKLSLDTKTFGQSVAIASVTPLQISEIVNQDNSDKSIQVAQNISVANSVSDILNNNRLHDSGSELYISRPVLVSENNLPIHPDNGEKTIQLRIILSK